MATLLTTSFKLLANVKSSTYSNFRLYGKYNSQSTETNKSSITLETRIYGNGGAGSFDSGTSKINSTSKSLGNTSYKKGKETILQTLTYEVEHNSAGTYENKTITANLTTSATPKGSITTQISLPTIPRASEITATSGYIGETVSVYISRKNTSFTETLTWSCRDLSGTIPNGSNATTVPFTIPTSLYTLIPNDKSVVVTITADTYNGSTKVGTKTTTLTARVDETANTPTVNTPVITETNTKISALTDKLVLNASKPKITITATAKNSATIKSIVTTNDDGQSLTGASVTFKEIGKAKFITTVTDSRGLITTKTIDQSSTAIPYVKPNIKTISIERESPISGVLIFNATGSFYSGTIGSKTNSLAISYRYKENTSEATWSNLLDIPNSAITFDTTKKEYKIENFNLGEITQYNKNYIFEIYYGDILVDDATPLTRTVRKGVDVFSLGEHDLKVNGDLFVADEDGLNKEKINVSGKISKNLFNKNTIVSGDVASRQINIRLSSRQNLWLEAGTYTFSTNLSTTYQFALTVNDVSVPPTSDYPDYIYDSTWQTAGSTQKTFTINKSGWFALQLRKADNGNLTPDDVASFNYQLEKGATVTSYEEYYEPTLSIRNSNNIFQEVQMPLISTRNINFNHDYVYETDLQYHCFKIGKMVVLNIHTIAFKQAINHGTHLMSNLPKATEFIVWYLQGGNDANGTSVRCSVNTYGDVSVHYGGTDRYGDSGSKQYSGTLIYKTSE